MTIQRFAALACLCATGIVSLSGPARADKFELTKDEKKLLELTNKEREKKKLPALKPNALLFKAARAHSANMARQEKMEHVLDGKTPGQRAKAAGYRYDWIAENIAAGEDWPLEGLVADRMG